MSEINHIQSEILDKVAGISGKPSNTAHNIRINSHCSSRSNSEFVTIEPKANGAGIDIYIRSGAKGERVYIPVVVSESGIIDLVRNDFHIEDGADVTIIAGCGLHNSGGKRVQHDGVHYFNVGRNARVRYEEKHYAEGAGGGEKVLNPTTDVTLQDGAYMEMETVQIEGVDYTKRLTRAKVGNGATLVVHEKLMTNGVQFAETDFDVELAGVDSGVNLISRSVAKDNSQQAFLSKITGDNRCNGHSECDAIILHNARVKALPQIVANHVDASLIHEAAIGKIAADQLTKLMTLGLTQAEAETHIINGFLK